MLTFLFTDKDPTGHPTIGWGHLCKSSSCKEIGYKIPLSKADGEKLLNKDLLVSFYILHKNHFLHFFSATATKVLSRQHESASAAKSRITSSSTPTNMVPWSAGLSTSDVEIPALRP